MAIDRTVSRLLDSFFYELSAYLLPGFIVLVPSLSIVDSLTSAPWTTLLQSGFVHAYGGKLLSLEGTDHELLFWTLGDLYNAPFLPRACGGWGPVEWILAVVGAYLVGMLISGTVFTATRYFEWLSGWRVGSGFYRLLRVKKPYKKSVEEYRSELLSRLDSVLDLEGRFLPQLDAHGKPSRDGCLLEGHSSHLSDLVGKYLEENSAADRPSARFYPRTASALNISLCLILSSILLLFVPVEEQFVHRVIAFGLCVGAAVAFCLYARAQIAWLAQARLRRFWVLTLEDRPGDSEGD